MDELPVVLLPGHLCDSTMWVEQINALRTRAQAQVIELGARTSVSALADDVLAAAPPHFALAGFSLGGYVALEILRRQPERVGRLALLDTSARPDTEDSRALRLQNIALAESGRFDAVIEAFVTAVSGPVACATPSMQARMRRMMGSHSVPHYVAQQYALSTRPDARDGLGTISCPTLIACGSSDAVTTLEMHEELAAGIRSSFYVPIPQAGHMATLEQPVAVSSLLLAWLQFP